eukprot:GEMP01033507.1.p1 GENE.GEMP01033507.1~~GEMP01033507.1.p1  ORF type:complete len:537 (+),score=87.52 GEMP01033507.1:211-1821(+)
MSPRFLCIWLLSGVLVFANLRGSSQKSKDPSEIAKDPSEIAKNQFEADMKVRGEITVMAELQAEIQRMGSWDAVKANNQDPIKMFKLVHFREKFVLDLLKEIQGDSLHFTWPEKIPGSRSPTSDFDVPIWVKKTDNLDSLGDDVKAAKLFAERVEKVFKGPPGKIFDTNIYVKEFSFKSLPFRGSSLYDTSNQDVAALTKLRRYMTVIEWDSYVKKIDSYKTTDGEMDLNQQQSDRYAESKVNLDEADVKHILSRKILFDKLADNAQQQEFKVARSDEEAFSIIESAIREADFDRVLGAEYALYLEGMEKVRAKQIELKRIELSPPDNNPSSEETLKWTNEKKALREGIKLSRAEAVYFAPEAYSSEGAFFHVVLYEQGGYKASVLEHLTPFDLFCSMNEQAGDFFKDVNFHYKDDMATALYQSSKYLKRFYDSIELLSQKISSKWEGVRNVKDIQEAIQPLYEIRKKGLSSAEKGKQATMYVENVDKKFNELLGKNVAQITSKVMEHLAKVNAEFRDKFTLRPHLSAGNEGTGST